jgi:hypothetical protein
MRFCAQTTIFSMSIIAGLTGSALAADMTGAEIKSFLAGKTAYLETTAASAGGSLGKSSSIGAMTARRSIRLPPG